MERAWGRRYISALRAATGPAGHRRTLQPDIVTDSDPTPHPAGTFQAEARATLFGYDPSLAEVRLLPRSRAWRLRGVIIIAAFTTLGLPLGAIPPHAPWVLAVLGTGFFLARRRWKWRFTLVSLTGTCPRCGAELQARAGRFREPHTLTCTACRNDVVLKVPAEVLEAHQAKTG